MDALILRVALLLSLPVSEVARMQATDVLAAAVAESRAAVERSQARDLRAISDAYLVNAAVWAPESLKAKQDAAMERAGLTPPTDVSADAFFAALPMVEPA